MIRGMARGDTKDVTLKCDKGESKTVFTIGTLTKAQQFEFVEKMRNGNGQAHSILVVRAALKAVTNYPLNGVSDHVLSTDEKRDEIVESLPLEAVAELLGEIIEFNMLGGDERKN